MSVRGLLPDDVRCALREIGRPASRAEICEHLEIGINDVHGRRRVAGALVELVDAGRAREIDKSAMGTRLWEPVGFDLNANADAAASNITVREDAAAEVVFDQDGQGHVTVAGRTTHSFWACASCGIPTDGKWEPCRNHPYAARFLKHIREESIGG